VLFDHHHAFDQDAVLFRDDAKNSALLALVFAGDDCNFVVTLDLDFGGCYYSLLSSTIGDATEPDSGKWVAPRMVRSGKTR